MNDFRKPLIDYIRAQARPVDKFSHQARLYRLAVALAENKPLDDDVLFAAAWLHDLGVFVGHRPEDPRALEKWDHLQYVLEKAPNILRKTGFAEDKIPQVLEVMRTHMPSGRPQSFEGNLLRDADILEQLGAVGILRTVSKVGRDTRFSTFADALRVLRNNLESLPGQLSLDSARRHAESRVNVLKELLSAAELEAGGIEW